MLFTSFDSNRFKEPKFVQEEEEEDKRWSLQEEISKLLKFSLEYGLCHWEKGVSYSVSPCPSKDGDYLCTNVLDIWPEVKKARLFRGPSHAALSVMDMMEDHNDMIDSSFVYGPGVLQFKLSSRWIAKVLYKESKKRFAEDAEFRERALQGNNVVYLQYTLARVYSITKKSRKKIKKLKVKEVEELILKTDTERELGIHLLRFTEILEEVCKVVMPHILCEYLFDLCEKFDSLCEKDKSDGSGEKTGEETSKLLLYEATAVVMKKCFHLLGITPIYKI
ncbi:arginine-tRNA ligase [Artemisia annua]|uniref:arginine--tRNA ligase n=1 Tax=Artemisia annua TaxID=35608 RepID=A0A2U1LPX8_ARTAN|nr:arginine-tRNA ligase [Artemisia annua]